MEYYGYDNNNRSFDDDSLKSSDMLDDGTVSRLKKAYLSQVIPISLGILVICLVVTAAIISMNSFSLPAVIVMVLLPVLVLFLLARIICALILAGKIDRREFNWTKGTITNYSLHGSSRNYHIYMAVNNSFYAMLWINNPYPKGTPVYVLSTRVFTSDENIVIKL